MTYITWDDAKRYAAWFSRLTGKEYRLRSEAEWEYAARAGSDKAYSWGDEIGRNNANCNGCGRQWDGRQPAPVGSSAPNAFGLHDLHGNVREWVDDCYHRFYDGAPADGSAWLTGPNCGLREVRSGSYHDDPADVRAAARGGFSTYNRSNDVGFRLARTLLFP